jgi:ubiquinone/menaquinone biosynthesis C-methylase UbiE
MKAQEGSVTAGDDRLRRINQHYGRPNLYEVILEELEKAGIDPAHPSTDDLAGFDQFHGGGKAATLGLLELADLPRGARILDVGGGYGGPARSLAEVLDANVTVLDVTDQFIRVGRRLTELTGLGERVSHQQGDALNMAFPDESFDVVWSQNATMNIPDKPRLFREISRVLRRGGRMAIQDVLAGPVQPIHFPVPWAHDASMSFLCTEPETRAMVEAAGFRIVHWVISPITTPRNGVNPGSRAAELVRHMDVGRLVGTRNTDENRIVQAWYIADRP